VSQFEVSSRILRKASQVATAVRAELYLNASLSNRDLPGFPVFENETRTSLIYYDEKAKSRFSGMGKLF